jgi:hypothetical protein
MIVKLIQDWSGAKAFTDINVSVRTAIYLKSIGVIDRSVDTELPIIETKDLEKKSSKPNKNSRTRKNVAGKSKEKLIGKEKNI